jgi:hypothetical protein
MAGINWALDRDRRSRARARRDAADDAAHFGAIGSRSAPGPSKAELRELAVVAQADFAGKIERLPTVVELRCPGCGHTGKAMVADGDARRFRCKSCGHRL